MERWAILLDDDTRRRLTEDHLLLGDLDEDDSGRTVLAFRDRFVALKVASSVGVPTPTPLRAARRPHAA